MDEKFLEESTREILEATSDESRMTAMSKFREKIVSDYNGVVSERDEYKKKYEDSHKQNVDMFLQIQKTKEEFKNDEGNLGKDPTQVLDKDKKKDEEDNLTYSNLIKGMEGELY